MIYSSFIIQEVYKKANKTRRKYTENTRKHCRDKKTHPGFGKKSREKENIKTCPLRKRKVG